MPLPPVENDRSHPAKLRRKRILKQAVSRNTDRNEDKKQRRQQNMKDQTNTTALIHSILTLTLVIWLPIQLQSAEPTVGKMPMPGKAMEGCEKLKEQKDKMKADMKSQDTELMAQVTKMNSAPNNKKPALVAAVVTRMVEQRIAMDARKASMEEGMMQHMMQHMHTDKEAMGQCPMMKGMKGMNERAAGNHKEHQAEQK